MIKEERLIPLKFDLMFKKVFGDEDNNDSIKYLLKCILGITPQEVIILNNEILSDSYYDKNTTVDLIIKLKDGTKINIEVNSNVNKSLIDRNLLCMIRIMNSNIKRGQKYSKLNKHIQINFDFKGYHKKPIMKYQLIDKENNEILSDKIEIIRIDVEYFTKKCYTNSVEKLDLKDKFIGLIGIEDKKMAMNLSKGNKNMEEILSKMEGFSKEEIMAATYDREEYKEWLRKVTTEEEVKQGIEKGLEQGIKKGIKKGINQEKKEIAKNMLNENIDIETISRVTKLTLDEIKSIENN